MGLGEDELGYMGLDYVSRWRLGEIELGGCLLLDSTTPQAEINPTK